MLLLLLRYCSAIYDNVLRVRVTGSASVNDKVEYVRS